MKSKKLSSLLILLIITTIALTSCTTPAPPVVTPGAGPGSLTNTTPGGATATPTDPTPQPTYEQEVSTWPTEKIATQLLFLGAGAAGANLEVLYKLPAGGIMLETPIPADIEAKMTQILAETGGAAGGTVKPFIASDEEGGRVQRFKNLIYPIPSATEMGQKPNEEITEITEKYAEKLHKFGVDMVFAPVLGLTYPGNYLANDYRTFAADPEAVFEKSQAWAAGFTKCNVIPVIKHWPGTGTAANTHTGSSLVSPLAELEAKDMLPFNKWFEAGTPAVMVGHVGIPGLTEENTPASLSEKAYTYLREKAGEDTIIITDSLLMDAASKSIGLTPQQAAVKAIKSGADMALITSYGTDYSSYIEAIITAIDTGEIEKSQAIKSAARILKLKAQKGLSY